MLTLPLELLESPEIPLANLERLARALGVAPALPARKPVPPARRREALVRCIAAEEGRLARVEEWERYKAARRARSGGLAFCEDCNGTGRALVPTARCPACAGSGLAS